MKPSRLAVDTNVLLDLAEKVDDVLDAVSVIDDRLPDADRLVPPSVLDELAYLADSGQNQQVRLSARRAVKLLRSEARFRPILELPVAPEKAVELAREFRQRQLLPDAEIHDSLILAETVCWTANSTAGTLAFQTTVCWNLHWRSAKTRGFT